MAYFFHPLIFRESEGTGRGKEKEKSMSCRLVASCICPDGQELSQQLRYMYMPLTHGTHDPSV